MIIRQFYYHQVVPQDFSRVEKKARLCSVTVLEDEYHSYLYSALHSSELQLPDT